MKVKCLLWVALAVLDTCSPVPLGDGDRRVVARELGSEVVVPTLDEVVARTSELTSAAQQLVHSQDLLALRAVQAAWRAARVPWKQADAFGFGPASDLRLTPAMDQVVDPPKIDALLAAATPIDEDTVTALGANVKGFHAIEHLLFGDSETGLVLLFSVDVRAERRRSLLVEYTRNLAARAVELRVAWAGESELIAHPGTDNETYPTVADSIDAFVNESVFLAEFAADARLGKPSGTATGGVSQPDLVESRPSDNSLADLRDTLLGIRNVYFGSRNGMPGKGIGKLIVDSSPSTDRDVREALAASLEAVAAIPLPYEQALAAHAPEIEIALNTIKELKTILGTEVVGVLGATLKFNDNDGD